MAIPGQGRYILIEEIDENIITKVRNINEYSDSFRILRNSIKEDRQRHPITLRLLTDDEKLLAKKMLYMVLSTGIIATKLPLTIISNIFFL